MTRLYVSLQQHLEPQSHVPVGYFMLIAVLIQFHCDLQKIIKADCPSQPLSITLRDLFMEEMTFEVNSNDK